jgi:hypothetical protein
LRVALKPFLSITPMASMTVSSSPRWSRTATFPCL